MCRRRGGGEAAKHASEPTVSISTQSYGTREIPILQVRHYRAHKVLKRPPGPHNGAGSGCMWQGDPGDGLVGTEFIQLRRRSLDRTREYLVQPHKGSGSGRLLSIRMC